MIDVIASITIKPGCREKLLARFHANMPNVLAEAGCIRYYPTVDIDSMVPPQVKDANVVTVVEQWESLNHLYAHLQAPHQVAFREDVKDWVAGLSLKILTKA